MRFDSELEAAGRRASMQAVPAPPPLAQLQQRADSRTSKRRMICSGLAAFVLVAVGLPVALNMRGSTTVQNVVSGTGELAPAAQVDSPPAEPAAAAQGDSEDGSSREENIRIQVDGDGISFSVRVLTGDEAASAAADAAASASETIDVDDLTVWVSGSGEQRTVAALVEPDVFVEVTGDADQLDKLIETLRDGGGMHNFGGPGGLGGDEWNAFFDENFDPFDEDWFDDFDGDKFESFFDDLGPNGGTFEGFGPDGFTFDFDFEDFDFEDFDFEGFDFDGDFDNFDFEGFDFEGLDLDGGFGNLGDLEDLLKELEEHQGDIEQFLGEGDFGFPFAGLGENFTGCISVSADTDGETFDFEYPSGCSADD